MPISVIARNDPRWDHKHIPPLGPDFLERQKAEHRARMDQKDEFTFEAVKVAIASPNEPKPTMRMVNVRYPFVLQYTEHRDTATQRVTGYTETKTYGSFAFACLSDNDEWLDDPKWSIAAKEAVTKFAALHKRRIADGPRQELGNMFNFAVELDGPIKEKEVK